KWRRAHAGNADALAPKVLDRSNVALQPGLDPQAAAMDAPGEFDIEALLDRLEEIHDEVMSDIVVAHREDVLVILPIAFDEADIEAFFLEKPLLDCGKDRRLAGQADIAHANLVARSGAILPAPREQHRNQPNHDYSGHTHSYV